MQKTAKTLIILYFLIVILKIIIATQVTSPSIFADEYVYSKMARSFSTNLDFSIHDMPTNTYPPLYPIVISLGYLVSSNMLTIFLIMKIINIIISSLIIIPAFLLSKELLDTNKSIIATTLIAIHTTFFNFSNYIMAENLYYPLFLTAIYFLYKSLKNNTIKNNILLGLFTGLTILTKVIGLVLIPIIGLIFLNSLYKKEFTQIKTKIIAGIIGLITISPWVIRNKIIHGSTSLIGNYSNSNLIVTKLSLFQNIFIFSNWFIMYLCLIILSSGVILFILNFNNMKERLKDDFFIISMVTMVAVLAMVSYNNIAGIPKQITLISWFTGRPIGRYIEVIIPLIIIGGIIGLTKLKQIKNPLYYLIPIFIIGSQLTFFQLFAINNTSLTPIGITKYIIELILFNKTSIEQVYNITTFLIMLGIFILIPVIIYKLMKSVNKKTLITIITIFFVLNSVLGAATIIYNAKTNWYPNDQIKVGIWVNNNLKDTIQVNIDKKYCGPSIKEDLCNTKNGPSLIGFFINKNIKVSDKPDGYYITLDILGEELIHKENNIKIYKINNA